MFGHSTLSSTHTHTHHAPQPRRGHFTDSSFTPPVSIATPSIGTLPGHTWAFPHWVQWCPLTTARTPRMGRRQHGVTRTAPGEERYTRALPQKALVDGWLPEELPRMLSLLLLLLDMGCEQRPALLMAPSQLPQRGALGWRADGRCARGAGEEVIPRQIVATAVV